MIAERYISDWKEAFSKAYLHAIAAATGIASGDAQPPDRDSIDLSFRSLDALALPRRPQLEAQVKCTSVPDWGPNALSFDLSVKNYNDLRAESIVPRILIVVCVPENSEDWLTQTEDELVLRHCAYWVSLFGAPDVANRTSVRVEVPRSNVFGVRALSELLIEINAGRRP